MKRSLKKTLKKQFGSAVPQRKSAVSIVEWFQQRLGHNVLVKASALTAATLSLVTGRPAEAVQLFPVDLSTYTGTPGNPNAVIDVDDQFGNTATVNFTWTGDTGNFQVLGPSNTLTGGFPTGSILEIQHDPVSLNESVTLNIDFGAEVEEARLIVIDVDRDNANTWQDQVVVGGSVLPNVITPGDQASPAIAVSPEAAANVAGIPLGIGLAGGPNAANPLTYTVDIVGNDFVGVYNPRNLDDDLENTIATRTEFTPANGSPTGGVDVNPTPADVLPNPQDPPEDGVEAQNQSPEGSITADYSAENGPLTNLTFTYGNGPASVADAFNPPGNAGYISNGNDNGGPGNHGVGLYTIFLVPGSIGTAKSASTPVQVSATEFDVTYTVGIENFGERTQLTNVQVTDDLTTTFNGTTGFTVIAPPTVISGPTTITGTGNDAFNGNGDQNLLNGTGSLAAGESAVIQYTVRLNTTAANITPGTTYNNIVVGSADTPLGLRITDISEDDSIPPNANPNPNPDPNDDDDPLETSPTPITLPALTVPNINVTEQVVGTPEFNPTTGPAPTFPGNTARVLYRVRVQNTGPERLTGVTLINDFTSTFDNGTRGDLTADTGFEIVEVTQDTTTGGRDNPVNPNYNGGDSSDSGGVGAPTEDATLATGGTLEPGEFSEYTILVDVDTTGNGENLIGPLPGPFDNFTTAAGLGSDPVTPSNLIVSDISNDATGADLGDPDELNPPGGSPTGGSAINPATPDPADPENTPTPVSIPIATDPRINVSEQVVSTVIEPTGTYGPNTGRVTYLIRVQNTGNEDLTNVNLINDFTSTFDDGSRGDPTADNGFEIISLVQAPGGVLNPINPDYDGGDSSDEGTGPGNTDDPALITEGNLAVGEFSEYQIVVDVDLTNDGENLVGPLPGPFNNSTTTNGVGVTSTIPVSDISNDATGIALADGLNPDGGDPTGGSTIGNPNDPNAPAPDPGNPENTPTPVNFPSTTVPQINVSEEVVNTQLNPVGGAFGADTGRVTYRIRVQNTGPEDLRDVTLINDFTSTFDDGTRGELVADNGFEIVEVRQVTGGGQTPNDFNAAYDGGDTDNTNDVGPANTNNSTLISGGDLNVGQFSEYEIDVDVNLANNGETLTAPLPGPFINSTLATGIGDDPTTPSNIPVADRSNDRNSVTPVPPDLGGALNPDGGSPTGGASFGDPTVDPITLDPGTADPENTPTPVEFPLLQPLINVSEQVISTEREPSGTFGPNTGRVTYRIRVQNTGAEDLTNVTLVNDFSDTFDNSDRGGSGPDTGFEIVSATFIDGVNNPVNDDYDGGDTQEGGNGPENTNDSTLTTGGNLAVGEFSEYEVVVDVDLTGNGETLIRELPGPFDNFTTAIGIGNDSDTPSGITVRDVSNDATGFSGLEEALNPPGGSTTGGGTNDPAPAPVPSTDPANENVPTPVRLTLTPEISVTERIDDSRTQVGAIPGSTFGGNNVRLVYQVVVRNIGIEDLQNVQLTNNFTDTFGVSGNGPTDDFLIVAPPTLVDGVTTVNVNPTFDGSGDLLLAGDPNDPGSTLNVGEFAVYEIVVDVNTAGTNVAPQLPGPFNNQTLTSGIGVISAETTTDSSNDINPFPSGGTTPDPTTSDPNGNQEANEPDENIPTPALLGADLKVVKRITGVIRGGVALPIAGIDGFNNQAGSTDDDTLATLSGNSLPLGVFDGPDQLQSGDIVEYTIYFFNAGIAQAANVEICDELQVPSVLQPNSLELASPTALSQLGTNLSFAGNGALLFPQAPLATLAQSCVSFPGSFPAGNPTGGLGVGAGGGVVAGGESLGLNVNASEVGAIRFTVTIP